MGEREGPIAERWEGEVGLSASALESPTSPRPSPPPRAERESSVANWTFRSAEQYQSCSAAARRGRRRRLEAAFEFRLDRLDLVFLRPELKRPPPLIAGLVHPAALPIGVAQMVVDRRVLRHQLDGLFEVLNRTGVIAHPVMRPAQAVDDVAVLWAQLDRLLDHLDALVEVFAAVDPGIAEIVQHQRLLGLQLERMLQILLGALPLPGALQRHSAVVKQGPALRQAGRGGAVDRLVVGGDRLGIALLVAQNIAELHFGG